MLEAGEKDGIPDYGIRKAREVVDITKESIARAHKTGVKIAMGTDSAVTPHGQNLHELGLIVEAGMSPMEAIISPTRLTAECLGWDNCPGTSESGNLTDLLVAQSNPLEDIRTLENILIVMKDGVIYRDLLAI